MRENKSFDPTFLKNLVEERENKSFDPTFLKNLVEDERK